MYSDDDLKPISALQHLKFCERQCYLAYVELLWKENEHTAEGHIFHERAHSDEVTSRNDVYTVRNVALSSKLYGITGQSDIIEFHKGKLGCPLPTKNGLWQPLPIEYKKGEPKKDSCDEVQLCAQAFCLEEKYELRIQEGALFYGGLNRRITVVFDDQLRKLTEELILELHQLYEREMRPPAEYSKKCDQCSLKDICLPQVTYDNSAKKYLQNSINQMISKDDI